MSSCSRPLSGSRSTTGASSPAPGRRPPSASSGSRHSSSCSATKSRSHDWSGGGSDCWPHFFCGPRSPSRGRSITRSRGSRFGAASYTSGDGGHRVRGHSTRDRGRSDRSLGCRESRRRLCPRALPPRSGCARPVPAESPLSARRLRQRVGDPRRDRVDRRPSHLRHTRRHLPCVRLQRRRLRRSPQRSP